MPSEINAVNTATSGPSVPPEHPETAGKKVSLPPPGESYLARLNELIKASERVLAAKSVAELLQEVVDAARQLIGARIGISGHGFVNGRFQTIGAVSASPDMPPCPPETLFTSERGGVYLELLGDKTSLRYTEAELRAHPRWRGLPPRHVPLHGLLGARLVGNDRRACGLIMLANKALGEFTEEDEALLVQLAALASLGLQHLEDHQEATGRAEEMSAVFSAMNDALIIYDAEGRPVKTNPPAVRLLGVDPSGFDRQQLAALFSQRRVRQPNGQPLELEEMPFSRALRGQTISYLSFQLTTPAGWDLDIEGSTSLIRAQGQVRGVVCLWRDVTARKQAERHLRQAHDQLEARVRERTADLAKLVDALQAEVLFREQAERHVSGVRRLLELFVIKSSRAEYLNAVVELLQEWCSCRCAGVRLLDQAGRLPYAAHVGYSREFLLQEERLCLETDDCACLRILKGQRQTADLAWTSDRGSFFCNQMSRLVAGENGHTEENVPAKPDGAHGHTRPFACLAAHYQSLAHAPIRYRGQIIGGVHLADPSPGRFPAEIVAFIETVAPLLGEALHRFEVEESLQESEQRFRSMFERHNSVMLLVEPESGRIEDANPAAATFYGYAREQLRQMRITDLNVLAAPLAAAQRQRAVRGEQNRFVFPHRLANGEIRTVEVHSSPIQVQGRLLLFSIIHDITERKLLEKEILNISEQERQRVGQDLHDSLGGRLAGAALMSKALAQSLRSLPQAALAEEIVQCINEAITQTRAIARGLCPVELRASGLVGGLTEFALLTQKRCGIPCHFVAEADIQIQELTVASHLFHIVQEAVNNAVRHGQPRSITIRLGRAGEQISLEIRDDGVGLPHELPASRGLGLRTMKYRADILGADLVIKPGEQSGTVVACYLAGQHAVPPEPRVCL